MAVQPRSRSHIERSVRLASGHVLDEVTIAYRTLGELNSARDNAVLVLHGYTTGPSMLDPDANVAEGSWSELVGSGKAIDTDRYFAVCPNMLGSCYGSTGPASANPATGKPYGLDFPRIVMADIVGVQKALLDALGVRRVAAAVGPSFGGYQALQWAAQYPAFVERIVAAVSAPFHPGAGMAAATLAQLSQGAGWREGRYAETPGSMVDALTSMRINTLTRYGVDAELASSIPDPAARAVEVRRLAREWAEGFDPGSLLTLAHTAEAFDLRPTLATIHAPVLMVLSRSDSVFSPQLAREFGPLLTAAKVPWSYLELDSEKGHFASGADAHLWSECLRAFLSTKPADWTSWGLVREASAGK